ncbi:MAG: M28 family peptidase [Planctomycetota bacterium]|nr:M28 family peptidase [Planctomycetota bacterium]
MMSHIPKVFRTPLPFITRVAVCRLAIFFGVVAAVGGTFWARCIDMPGRSYQGPRVELAPQTTALAVELERDVRMLAGEIGMRSTFHPRQYAQAALWAKEQLAATGLDVIDHSTVARGSPVPNIQVTLRGTATPEEFIVVGAHIDSFQGTPGADDNASGVAALLALARRMSPLAGTTNAPYHSIRFVLFVNEEPPAFWTDDMGSRVYVRQCVAAGDRIAAMFSLESMGTFTDEPNSQSYPPPLGWCYPTTGNFLAIVGNLSSVGLTRRAVGVFRDSTPLACEGACLPWWLPGVGWSDHSSFWDAGIPAVMVTTTAPFRNPRYHTPQDTPDMLNYPAMALAVEGLERVIADAARAESP